MPLAFNGDLAAAADLFETEFEATRSNISSNFGDVASGWDSYE